MLLEHLQPHCKNNYKIYGVVPFYLFMTAFFTQFCSFFCSVVGDALSESIVKWIFQGSKNEIIIVIKISIHF